MAKVKSPAAPWPDLESRTVAALIYDHSLPFVQPRRMKGPCYKNRALTALHAAFVEKFAIGIDYPSYRAVLYEVHGWTEHPGGA